MSTFTSKLCISPCFTIVLVLILVFSYYVLKNYSIINYMSERIKKQCLVSKCSNTGVGNYCSAHYKRLRIKKTLMENVPIRKVNLSKIDGYNRVKHPLYSVWRGMKNRCNNKNLKSYVSYGARGIKVCERWNSFDNFVQDMGKRPAYNYQLERIDNDGNYEPSNCRWATCNEQSQNRRTNKISVDIAKTIRSMYASGMPQKIIGNKFGISQDHVSRIVNNKYWKV